jgi:Na+/H+ antiporter NhaD/arsenite permease-like protein
LAVLSTLDWLLCETEGELPPLTPEVSSVLKKLVCTTVLLFGATALRANIFSFSYAGVGLSAAGTVTASALAAKDPKDPKDPKVTSVPEPSTLLLLFAMGLGVLVLARKLPSKTTPSQ